MMISKTFDQEEHMYHTISIPDDVDLEDRKWRKDIRKLIPYDKKYKICVMVISSKERIAKYTFCNTHEEADPLLFSDELSEGLSFVDICHVFELNPGDFEFKIDPL